MKFVNRAQACALLIFSLLLTAIPFARTANAQTAGVKKITSVEGITEYQLDNGLKVLLFPDQTKDSITVNITYMVGSRHENYGETGMAHLLEHLVFKGTPKHPDIPAELTSHGARPNGTTWVDRTNYFESFKATDENLNWALDLEADRMVNSYIAEKDLKSEFSVVRNEMESGENNPFRVVWQRVMGVAYEWHNYGKSTIGARSDVENVPIDRLQAFYKRYYQPDNSVLVVSGKIDEAKTLGLVQKYFGSIPKPSRVLPPNYTIEPTQDGERMVTVRRVGDSQMLMSGYHIPAGAHTDYAALEVMHTILTDEPSGRLYKSLVESKKASSIFGLQFANKEPGYSLFVAELPKDKSIDEARNAMIETVETFAKTAPTKEEVERAKLQSAKNNEQLMNSPERAALELSEWIAQGDWRLMFLHRDRVQKVTPEDVQRVASKYLKATNRTVGQFIPTEKADRAEIPNITDAEVATVLKDYKGNAVVAAGEAFDPSPANIKSRTTKTTVGNLKAAFLPKENRGDTVFAAMTLRFGDEKALMNRGTAGSFVSQMLNRGTAKHTRQQLQDELDRLKAQVNIFGSASNVTANIQTTRQNLPEVMKLVAEMFKESTFPADEFDKLKAESITQIEANLSEPTSKAIEGMNKHFNRYPKGDIRYQSTSEEQIAELKALTVEDVKKFYKDFYSATTGEIAVVGDFDTQPTQDLIGQLFGDWKNTSKFARVPSEYFDVAAVNQAIETPDKANAFFFARLNLKLRDDSSDYAALQLGNFMFGGGFLNSRFLTRIRQKDGVSYGGGSGLNAASLDESGTFFAQAIYAPENVEKVEKGFREELDRVLKDGFTTEELEAAKKGFLQNRQQQRAEDRSLVNILRSQLYLNRTMDFEENLDKQIEALTADQVNAAFRKYMSPDKISVFKAGDFAKAKAKMNAQ
ncbi:MAG TPA: pitrilysin family protein [Pyrinomonadaceae bacterium]|nr:pitrilysin family protein [Pyrinomonadaceae bacterium]